MVYDTAPANAQPSSFDLNAAENALGEMWNNQMRRGTATPCALANRIRRYWDAIHRWVTARDFNGQLSN
jgi:hypothetical protein